MYVYPILAQLAGAAQGLNAAASLPISLTADALTAMFLLKLHQDPSYRLLGSIFGISHSQAHIWVTRIRNYVFENDQTLVRNRNLSNAINLEAILEEAHQSTLHDTRVVGLYSHLCLPGQRLAVMDIDSRAVRVQKSTDFHLQHRTHSTKINNNSVQKLTIASMDVKALITFPLMVSISPAGTDESNSELLVVLEEAGLPGGLKTLLLAQTPPHRPQYKVVLLGM